MASKYPAGRRQFGLSGLCCVHWSAKLSDECYEGQEVLELFCVNGWDGVLQLWWWAILRPELKYTIWLARENQTELMAYVNQEGAQLEAQGPGQLSKPKASQSMRMIAFITFNSNF